jgi:phytanoyl-CoA hydroxylase
MAHPWAPDDDRSMPTTDSPHSYESDGFAVLPDVLSPAEVGALRAETVALCRGDRGEVDGVTPADPGEADDDVIRRYLCIHHPHKLSATMAAAQRHPTVVAALRALIGPDVKAMQSMLFIKAEGRPGQAWHQDEHFIPTRDRSLTAVWVALDDATVDNGCLWVLPGSHRPGVIYPNREHDDPRFDCTVESYAFPHRDEDAVPVQVPAGSALVFNGYLLHKSMPNTGRAGFRRALVNHYMSATSPLAWGQAAAGDHFADADYRDIVLIAGTDPYAYKGLAELSHPGVRPDRDGGCDR